MNRRFAMGAAGLAAAAAMSSASRAQQHEHHNHATAPAAPAGRSYKALQRSAAVCISDGQACLAHCIELLAQGDKSLGDCAKGVNQMLALCGALESLASQGSRHTPALARVALDVCKACSEACKQHVDHHAQCKACYESCLECIKQCEAVA